MGAYDCDCINNLEYDRRERKQKEQSRSTAQSTDLIDRRDAIEKFAMTAPQMSTIHIYEAVDILDSLPTVQPEPHWIPVSERLPEDLSEVNVTWVNHNPELYYESTKDKPFTATAVYYKNEWYWYSATCVDYLEEYGRCDWNKIDEAIEIIAWMPLPEAYKPNK